MEATGNETIMQQSWAALHIKKSLLPIDEYVRREGLSRSIVENRGKLGVVQIRKYKGKTYVVDVPVSPYLFESKTAKEKTQSLGSSLQAERPAAPARKPTSHGPGMSGRSSGLSERAGKIKSARTVTAKPRSIIEKPKKAIPSTEANRPSESSEIALNDEFRLRALAAQAKSGRIWQVTSILSLVFVFAACLVSFWFYMDRRVQLERADSAYATVTTVHQNYLQAKRQVETLRSRIESSSADLERSRYELSKSQEQIKTLRNQLAAAGRDVRLLRRRYFETVRQLEQQIEKLNAGFNELAAGRATVQKGGN